MESVAYGMGDQLGRRSLATGNVDPEDEGENGRFEEKVNQAGMEVFKTRPKADDWCQRYLSVSL